MEEIVCKYYEGILTIRLKDGSMRVKTEDEMALETPNFRGIVTQTNLFHDINGEQLTTIDSWFYARGYVAEAKKDGKIMRTSGGTYAEAFNRMKELLSA